VERGIDAARRQATTDSATDLPAAVTFEECQIEDVQIPNRPPPQDLSAALQEESATLAVQNPVLRRRRSIDSLVDRVLLEADPPIYQALPTTL
jgi:hypothetical protein